MVSNNVNNINDPNIVTNNIDPNINTICSDNNVDPNNIDSNIYTINIKNNINPNIINHNIDSNYNSNISINNTDPSIISKINTNGTNSTISTNSTDPTCSTTAPMCSTLHQVLRTCCTHLHLQVQVVTLKRWPSHLLVGVTYLQVGAPTNGDPPLTRRSVCVVLRPTFCTSNSVSRVTGRSSVVKISGRSVVTTKNAAATNRKGLDFVVKFIMIDVFC